MSLVRVPWSASTTAWTRRASSGLRRVPWARRHSAPTGSALSHLGLGACAGPRRLGRAGRAGKAAAQMDHGARLARIAQLQPPASPFSGRSSMRYPRRERRSSAANVREGAMSISSAPTGRSSGAVYRSSA